KKILMLAGDAAEALDIYYPSYRCLGKRFEPTTAAASTKKLHTAVHDSLDSETYAEKPDYLIVSRIAFGDLEPTHYDALYIPGGRAPEHGRLNKEIPDIVGHFFEANKPIASVCHGSMILTMVPNHIKNREFTAYIACKPEVEATGATYIDDVLHEEGNLVSGHAWPDLPGLMKMFISKVNNS